MKGSKIYIIFFLLISIIASLNSFVGEGADFVVTKNDIQLRIPEYFPRPLYDFNENKVTAEGFMLGRKLFYDPILSKDSSVSCGSCHQHSVAFAHLNQTFGRGIEGLTGKRNVPSLQNLMWQNSFMLDGRVPYLEKQPLSPITNPIEMNETFSHVVNKLRRNKEYVALFKRAFNNAAIDSEKVLKALAQFTGMLVSGNSRYDKYLRGEEKLTEQEMHGFVVFRLRCENCHQEPLFTDNSFRNIGLEPDSALGDSGRMAITGLPADYMKFRVPSLRNIALTSPYMHDGRFKTLKEVLDHYGDGVFFTHNVDGALTKNVGIMEGDKADIIVFLKTLTDEQFVNDKRFDDPNSR